MLTKEQFSDILLILQTLWQNIFIVVIWWLNLTRFTVRFRSLHYIKRCNVEIMSCVDDVTPRPYGCVLRVCLNSSAGNIKQQEWITCNTFESTHHKVNINGEPCRVAQSVERLTQEPEVPTYFSFSFRWFKKGSCQLLTKVCSLITG